MAQIADLEEHRKKQKKKHTVKQFFALIAIAVAIATAYVMRFDIASYGVTVWLSDAIALAFDNTGYPVNLEFLPIQIIGVQNRAAVITDGGMSVYNKAGNKVIDHRITSSNPLASSKNGNLMVYAQGGKEISIRAGDLLLYNAQTQQPIFTAELFNEGGCVYSTSAVGYQSQVTALDKNYDEIFVWASSDEIITTIATGKNPKIFAAGGLYSENGVLSSKLLLFDLEKGDMIYEIDISDEVLLGINLQDDGSVIAVTDKAVRAFYKNGIEKKTYKFEGERLVAFDFDDQGGCVVAVGNYKTSHSLNLIKLNDKAEMVLNTISDKDISYLECYKEDVIIFTGEWAVHLSKDLNQIRMIETFGSLQGTVIGDDLYYTTEDKLYRVTIA